MTYNVGIYAEQHAIPQVFTRKTPHMFPSNIFTPHALTCRVTPSSTYRLSVNGQVPVSVLLTSPVSDSTAYS